MTKEHIVLAELSKNGAATAFELGAELDWPMRIASAHVTNLLVRGYVEHDGQVRQGTHLSYMYKITAQGERRLARLNAPANCTL